MTLRELLNELNEIASKDESLLDAPLEVVVRVYGGLDDYAVGSSYDGYDVFDHPSKVAQLMFESREGR